MVQEFGDRPGKLRNRYTVQSLIARGGMAEVYRAHDEFLGRDVAVKVFRASAAAENEFRRQEDEVNVLARLNHPNLVTLLDAAIDRSDAANPRIYYVMELVEGTDLKRRLDDGPLGGRQIAQLGYYVATALEHVHSKGIVHRDVKPANILITVDSDGSRVDAKLGDFGIASVGPASAIADDEVVTGTVAYLSPEQARGDEVTAASDVYSLGLVLLQCFTGELAFPGPPQHSAMARLLDNPRIPDDLPPDWLPLLTAMTAREVADRPDIHDVAIALRQMFATETGRHKATVAPAAADDAARLTTVHHDDSSFDRITALAARVAGFEGHAIADDELATLEELATVVTRELQLRRQIHDIARNQSTPITESDWQDSLTSTDVRQLGAAPLIEGDALITNRPVHASDGLLSTNPPLVVGRDHAREAPTGPVELAPAT